MYSLGQSCTLQKITFITYSVCRLLSSPSTDIACHNEFNPQDIGKHVCLCLFDECKL